MHIAVYHGHVKQMTNDNITCQCGDDTGFMLDSKNSARVNWKGVAIGAAMIVILMVAIFLLSE